MMPPSSRKKRKLESPSANIPPLSAIAARRAALQSQVQGRPGQNGSEISPKPKRQEESELFDSRSLKPVLDSYVKERPTVETTLNKKVIPDEPMISEDDEASSSSESSTESPQVFNRPSVALSTFKPSKDNVKELKNGGLLVRLSPGERLVILGQYEMIVQKGEVTLLSATLTASKKSYMVYSPASHSLPVIRCSATDVNNAEICFQPYKSGLETLQGLSPLFGKLWNEDCGPLGPDFESLLRKQKSSTYQMLFSSQENPPKSYLQPLISPPEWNATLSRIATSESSKNQITMICGPKSSGKSTFTRFLTNKLLSSNINAKNQGIALLDLDPGQPEYSIPGNLSLTHLRDPNFGPPFTHPQPSGRGQTIRTHAISAITPSMDPTLYMACASDLYTHYRKLLSTFPKCPLIINTPGWVLGTGLEILVELITKVRPTEVLYMSEEGPREVVESLKEAAKSTSLYTLPSQSSEFTTRTAAHLRTMQYMSYFHLNPTTEGKLSWNNTPLTSLRPWEIKYDGENAGILGVMCYGEQPPPSLLVETINGSLLSLLVVEEISAIPGWESKDEIKKDVGTKPKTKQQPQPQSQDFISLTTTSLTPNKSTTPTSANSRTISHRLVPTSQPPTITHTPESVPYFHTSPPPLPPQSSQSLGLLLVRGIDVPRKRLQVLTSIPLAQLQALNDPGKKVILVSGKLDTPGWAYTEELNLREGALKSKSKEEDSSNEGEEGSGDGKADDETHDAFKNVPWVEKLEGSQGRGVGARVWRVRRDLGKSGDGD